MKAAKRYDPSAACGSSFAVHGSRRDAEYILRNWRILKVAPPRRRGSSFQPEKPKQSFNSLGVEGSRRLPQQLGVKPTT